MLIHEPAWLSYPEEVKLANGRPRFIPFDCPVEQFERYFTDSTRMVVICNPSNPAGRVYTREELEYLYSVCRPKGIYVMVDEAYSDFMVDDVFVSMVNVVPDKDGIIVTNSLSKSMGISGWRIGYVISSEDVAYSILKLSQHLITRPPTVLMLYLAEYFDDILRITLPQARAVTYKRMEVEAYCKQIGLDTLSGSATFYLFVSIGVYQGSSLDLALYLLARYRISVVPGLAYGPSVDRYVRVGVGAEDLDDIKACLSTIKGVVERDEYDFCIVQSELRGLGAKRFEVTNRESYA